MNLPVLADGATGTCLAHLSMPPDGLCITLPDEVMKLHNAYIQAGASIIRTNSFNLSAAPYEAARIAIDASGGKAEVWGVAGPGQYLPSHGQIRVSGVKKLYVNHLSELKRAGIQHLHLETITDPLTLRAALSAADEIGFSEISVSAFLSPSPVIPLTINEYIDILSSHGIRKAGLNCMSIDFFLRRCLEELTRRHDFELLLFPNAGKESPGQWSVKYRELIECFGVRVAGGCCESSPAHIRSLREVLDLQVKE